MSTNCMTGGQDFGQGLPPPVQAERQRYGVTLCACGHPSCHVYWLTGIGSFVLGSGFTQAQAQRIADLLNADGFVSS